MNRSSIFETSDGSHSLYSEQYEVSYHSKYGALTETRHVFIEAGLQYRAVDKQRLNVLGIGFGSGLNAFITMLEARRQGLHINYEAIEAYPLQEAQWKQLNYAAHVEDQDAALLFSKLHELPWHERHEVVEHFHFTKRKKAIEELQYMPTFDVIYFDAFAPNAQPELWGADVMQRMHDALLPGGALVTYCAKGAVKRTLRGVGFEVEALPGPPGKREMTRAVKSGERVLPSDKIIER